MNILIVVSNVRDWPIDIPGVKVLSAREYLADPGYGEEHYARVFNLCQSYRYQSMGYYVSLLAEARGHKPLPKAGTLGDLQDRTLVRLLTQDLDIEVNRVLAAIKGDLFELSIYFGRNTAKRYDNICRQLFAIVHAPLLRATFERHGREWRLRSLRTIGAADIPLQHQDFVVKAAKAYFAGRRPRRRSIRHEIAILVDPQNPEPPSNGEALKKFEKAAAALGMSATFVTRGDFGRLNAFDALFIRDTTYVNHYTYRFSRLAQAEGLAVIDDPDSIMKCGNKVYLAEVFSRHGVSIPKTMLVHRDNIEDALAALSFPSVLKAPDSSFSLGVKKFDDPDALRVGIGELLAKSDLVIAQKFLPTEFDWRIGIIDRKIVFAAKYYMAPGHWQIIDRQGGYREGPVEAVSFSDVPAKVLRLALRAANLVGDGFYGVDLKMVGDKCYVIEINDNPNVDAGNEDGVEKGALYRRVMQAFLRRIESRRQ